MNNVIYDRRLCNRAKIITKIEQTILEKTNKKNGYATLVETELHQFWCRPEEDGVRKECELIGGLIYLGEHVTEAITNLQRQGLVEVYFACDVWRLMFVADFSHPRTALRPYEILLKITKRGKRRVCHGGD